MIELEELEEAVHSPKWKFIYSRLDEYKDAVIYYTQFLNNDATIHQRVWHIRNKKYEPITYNHCRFYRNIVSKKSKNIFVVL